MKPAAFLALLCACFALAQPARGAIDVGLADNTMLGNADGGASYLAIMNDVGLRELRMPVQWDPARPSRIGTADEFSSTMTLSRPSAVSADSRGSTGSTETASRVRPVWY